MARVFVPATGAKTVPTVRSATYDAAETFLKGAVLGVNADGEVIELTGGAGVNDVVGVALEDVASKPGWNAANDDKIVWRTGVVSEVSMVDLVEDPDQIFSGRLVNTQQVDVVPTQTHILESRGLIILTDGTWAVNDDDVTNDAVQIVDIVVLDSRAGSYILFKFLPAVIANTANIS